MLAVGLPEGTRNESFFNMAVYLLRKYEDREVVKRKLYDLDTKYEIGLSIKEIDTLVMSAGKKDYGYKCTVSPLKDFCQRAKCRKRDFGVGSKRDSGLDGSEVLRAVAAFNDEYAIARVQGGIEYVEFSEEGPRFIDETALRRWTANRTVAVNGQQKSVYDVWLAHPDRRQYDGVVTEKGYNGPALNLWRGYGVTPRAGDVSLWYEYLDLISGGDPNAARWVEHYAAHAAQNPTDPSVPTALAFRGRQGQGKSHFQRLIRAAMPNCVIEISDAGSQLLGRFNRRFMGVTWLFAEEAIFSGDPRLAQKLKTLISSPKGTYEEKFGQAIEAKNNHRLVAFTNQDQAVLLEDDDRRWTILDVPKTFDLSTTDGERAAWRFWEPHFAFARDGGPALLHHLLNVEADVQFINFGYRTSAKGEDKIGSDPLLQLLIGIALDGELPGDTQGKGVVSNSNLAEAMRETVRGSYGKAIPAESIGQRVKKLVLSCTPGVRHAQYVKHEGFTSDGVPRTTTKGSQRGIQFGSLLELRQDLERIVGPRDWNGPQTWQQWRVVSAMEEPPF